MASDEAVAAADEYGSVKPVIREIRPGDLIDALAKGFADFRAVPTHLIFLFVIYPVIMFILARLVAGYEILPLIFPLVAGYTLIGPVVATGTYELSRRREMGLETNRLHAFGVVQSKSIQAIAILAIMLAVIYFIWLAAALAIYKLIFGGGAPVSLAAFAYEVFTLELGTAAPSSTAVFIDQILTSSSGWRLIIVGSGVGFVFATVVFSFGVVSFPMLLDQDVGAFRALQTSIKVVLANPVTMAIWGIIVVILLFIGALPFFAGLAIALPVLGHATWHVYRKAVAP